MRIFREKDDKAPLGRISISLNDLTSKQIKRISNWLGVKQNKAIEQILAELLADPEMQKSFSRYANDYNMTEYKKEITITSLQTQFWVTQSILDEFEELRRRMALGETASSFLRKLIHFYFDRNMAASQEMLRQEELYLEALMQKGANVKSHGIMNGTIYFIIEPTV